MLAQHQRNMQNKIILLFLLAANISFGQKQVVCLSPKMNAPTSFDTSRFYFSAGLADNYYYYWDNGKTLYVKFLNGSSALQQKSQGIIKQWEQYANIHFKFVNDHEPAHFRIDFSNRGYIKSQIGTYAMMLTQQEPTMIIDTTTFNNTKFMQAIILQIGRAHV